MLQNKNGFLRYYNVNTLIYESDVVPLTLEFDLQSNGVRLGTVDLRVSYDIANCTLHPHMHI